MLPVFVQTKEEVLAVGLRSILQEGVRAEPVFCDDTDGLLLLISPDFSGVILSDHDHGGTAQVVARIRERSPDAKVVLWVRDISIGEVRTAIELGARGILRKDLSADLTRRCIERVAAGEFWLERTLSEALLHTRTVALSRRQRQLLMLISQGLSNKEIASALTLSEGTVKVYLSKLFRKIGARDRFDLALYGIRNMFQDGQNVQAPLNDVQWATKVVVTRM